MTDKNENLDPAQVIKRALGAANFEYVDIGGKVFALLDSLHSDFLEQGTEISDTTEKLSQEIIDELAGEYDKIRSDVDEEEEEEEEEEVQENILVEMLEDALEDEDDTNSDEDEEDKFITNMLENDDENDEDDSGEVDDDSPILQSFDHLSEESDSEVISHDKQPNGAEKQ